MYDTLKLTAYNVRIQWGTNLGYIMPYAFTALIVSQDHSEGLFREGIDPSAR